MIVLLSIVFFFFILFGRLTCVQIVDGSKYSAKAAKQWYRDLPLAAQRGIIYDRNGEIIVGNKTVYTVYVRPGSVNNTESVARILSETLALDYEKVYNKISKRNVSEVTVKKGVDEETGKKLIDLNLSGVYFSADCSRDYVSAEYLTQVIGYTNIDNQGQNGLEGYYDKFLRGINGSSNVQSDNRGAEIVDGEKFYLPAIDGANIRTTIDVNIQSFVEESLNAAMIEWKSKSANMIVMDAKSGAIVAMGQKPSYSLDDIPRNDLDMLNAYSKNTMIVDVYEPGSTFKIMTTAIAIENGVVNNDSTFFCPGYRMVDGQRIKCWRSIGHGSQHLPEGVMNSCNCVFMDLALKLGTNDLYDGLRKLGFGAKTGVDFFSESSGLLMNQNSVKNVDLARIGFGQAVAVTPLQLAAGVCEVVNGGYKVTPHFAESIYDNYGNVIYNFSEVKERVLSEETSSQMRTLLENVVSKGSGKKAAVAGYRIGGKTGTAQKYENGTIAGGKYVSSFVGFAPADNPKYVILMTVDEPSTGAYYGSIVAAPYVGKVFSEIFDYEAVLPDREIEKTEYFKMPQVENCSVFEAVKQLESMGLYCEVDGDGDKVISSLPVVGSEVCEGDIVLIRT